jgi:hypothetical protein
MDKSVPLPATLTDRSWFERCLEIFPGAVSWGLILSPVLLSILSPVAVAYLVIAFDLLWLFKVSRLSFYLVRGYARLHRAVHIDWQVRLKWLKYREKYVAGLTKKIEQLGQRYPGAASRWQWSDRGRQAHAEYIRLVADLNEVKRLTAIPEILDVDELTHVVIIATYNETPDIVESSIKALTQVNYPLKQLILVIAYEERGGPEIEQNAHRLIKLYGARFKFAAAYQHPDKIPGEVKGKGGNITWSGRQIARYLERQGVDPVNVIVTTFDADHRPDREYFAYLSYHYAADPERIRHSYQPIPMFYNNIWDAPAPMRVIATGSSFWMIMESMRPHRLRNFAAHAQSLQALLDTDFWSVATIVEDGHQFWRTYFRYDGDHQVVPLYTPIFQDAVLAKGYLRTFKVQYLQLRRWAWGVSDFPFVVRHALKNPRIPWSNKLVQIARLFEGHLSWATAPLILTFAAWLPLLLNKAFRGQLLAHQLPVIASRILSLTTVGILVTVFISLISLPERPARYRRTRVLGMLAQWLLLPFTAIVFSAFAALDAQTRLMIGKYMEVFVVTEKARKS